MSPPLQTPEQVRRSVAACIAKLRQLRAAGQLPRYVTHIRFPKFKNLDRASRIEFPFPVTALVGPNGCGKTSALHALYGAPKGMSTSDYWFATDVDPIKEGNGEVNRFIYGHLLPGIATSVETRKARVGSSTQRRVGYFEPTKAVSSDDMDLSPFPAKTPVAGQSKDRWNPVDRPLLYVNFRSELSAFDKYLFWGRPKPTLTLRGKHDRLQLGAKRLNKVLQRNAKSALLYGRNAVTENRELSKKELDAVCAILGKRYEGATLVRHAFYGGEQGLTVQFKTGHARYTEAFAGSGELAVTSLVVQLLAANANTLILLDEPEVSLHPGAQERLLLFLMEQCVKHKHQVVFTTHSPSLIRYLPADAIKVFYESANGTFSVTNESHPYAAFYRIGAPVPGRLRVLTEDKLAKVVVQQALILLEEAERGLVDVTFLPGGAHAIFAHRIPTLMHDPTSLLCLLDGDQAPPDPYPDPQTIPASDDTKLLQQIRRLTACENVQFAANGGADESASHQLFGLQRTYLSFLHGHVDFLPRQTPEHIILASTGENVDGLSAVAAKERLREKAEHTVGLDSSDAVVSFANVVLGQNRHSCADLVAIAMRIRTALERI